jgi:hypothetical protein
MVVLYASNRLTTTLTELGSVSSVIANPGCRLFKKLIKVSTSSTAGTGSVTGFSSVTSTVGFSSTISTSSSIGSATSSITSFSLVGSTVCLTACFWFRWFFKSLSSETSFYFY